MTRHVSQIASMLEMINRAGGLAGAKDMYVYSTSLVEDAIKAQSSWTNEWNKLQHSIESSKRVLLSFIDGPGVLFIKTLDSVIKGLTAVDNAIGHSGSVALTGGLGMYGIMKGIKNIWGTVHAVDPIKQMFSSLGKDQAKALELVQKMMAINAGDAPDKINKLTEALNSYTSTATVATESGNKLWKALKGPDKLKNTTSVIGNFITANKLLLAITAAIAVGLYIWKKHEESVIEFNEQLKDAKKNLLDYRQLSLEMSTEDRLTQTVLSQATAFTKLRGAISEAQYALSDILEKLADVKPVKTFLSEEMDSKGFSDLNQEALIRLIKKQDENVLNSFRKNFANEIKEFDKDGSQNQQEIEAEYIRRKSIDPDTKREMIVYEQMIKKRAFDFDKLRKQAEIDRKDYETIQYFADYRNYNKKIKQAKTNVEKDNLRKEQEQILQQASKQLGIDTEVLKLKMSFSNNTGYNNYTGNLNTGLANYNKQNQVTDSLVTLASGKKLDISNYQYNSYYTKELKARVDNAKSLNEILKQENAIRGDQIDSLRAFNSALNTYTEYFRNRISKEMLQRSGQYNEQQLDNLVNSNTNFGKYMLQHMDTMATEAREMGIDPSLIYAGDENALKQIGELKAIKDSINKLEKTNSDAFGDLLKSPNFSEISSFTDRLKLDTKEDYLKFLNQIFPKDNKEYREALDNVNKSNKDISLNLSQIDTREEMMEFINPKNTLSAIVGLDIEETNKKYGDVQKKYKKIFKEGSKNLNSIMKNINEDLVEQNVSYSSFNEYLFGDKTKLSKEELGKIESVLNKNDKNKELQNFIQQVKLAQNDISLKFLESLADNMQTTVENILLGMGVGKQEASDISKKIIAQFKDPQMLAVMQNQQHLNEQEDLYNAQKELINLDAQRIQYQKQLEQLNSNHTYDLFIKNRKHTLAKYEKILKTGNNVSLETSISKMDSVIDIQKAKMANINEQLEILYMQKRNVGLDDIELNKKIIALENQRLSEFQSSMEALLSQKSEIMNEIEDVFKNQEFNLDVQSNLKSLIFERVKTIYQGIADDFLDIRENMQKQAVIYEKQYMLEQKYNALKDNYDKKDLETEMYKYAEEYNQNVAELFKLQNEIVAKQKSALEKGIVSSLENMSRMAKGEKIELNVGEARTKFAQALSALAFKDKTQTPEMLMVENSRNQLDILKDAAKHLEVVDTTLKQWYSDYKKINPMNSMSIIPGTYGQFEIGDKNITYKDKKYKHLVNSIDKATEEVIRPLYLDTTLEGVNKHKLFSYLSTHGFKTMDTKGNMKYTVAHDNIDELRSESEKNFLTELKNDELTKRKGLKLLNIGNNVYNLINTAGQHLGTLAKMNDEYKYLTETAYKNEYDATVGLYRSNPKLFTATDEIRKAVSEGIQDGTLKANSKDVYYSANTPSQKNNDAEKGNNLNTGNLELKKINAKQENDYANSVSKILSLAQGFSAISVIMQDLRNAEFSKKIEDLKETFEDQKIALEREKNLAPTNAEKFEKEVEMWNLEARQQAELDTLTEENRIENELVSINQTIAQQSMEMIKHLSAISSNTSADSINGLFKSISGTKISKGSSIISDIFGNVSVVGENGKHISALEAISQTAGVSLSLKPQSSDNSLTKGKDISKGVKNSGFVSPNGTILMNDLQGQKLEFDSNIYNSAKEKLAKGENLSLLEFQHLQEVYTNGGTMTNMGSAGDYLQSLTMVQSGINNGNIAEFGAGLANLGKTINGTQTLGTINKFLNGNFANELANSALGKKFGLDNLLTKGQDFSSKLVEGSKATGLTNTLGYVGGGLSAVGGGLQIGQMIGTGKFDTAGALSSAGALYTAGSMLSGTTAAGTIGTALGGGAALGGAALAGAIALPAIAVGAYASKQLSRRAKAKAKLKQNDVLREKEAEQYQKMLEALNSQKNPLLNAMTQQNTSVGYDEAMRRALMSAPLTASSAELFKDYQVSYRGGKFGQGRKRKKWVYSAANATVGIQDFGYNTISDLTDSYGLLNNISNKMQELDKLLGSRGRDSGSREQRKEWATWYATKEASQMLYDQIKGIQESMVKSLSTLTQAYFGFETVGLNKQGGIAQEGEQIDRYTTGAWQERTNILNTFVQDFLKAGNTVGENIAKIFVEGASNAFVKNNTELNKIMNKLEEQFENLANSFVNTDDLTEALEFELSSGSNDPEVYQSIFDQLKKAGYGNQKDYELAQNALKDKNYKEFVEIMKQMMTNGNGSNQSINELIKTLKDLEEVQSSLEEGMRDFVDQWVEGGGKLSDIIASMDNILSRSADLISELLISGDATAGLENFKTIITDKILPEIKDVMIDSMQQDIFGFEGMMKEFKDKLLSGNLSFSGADGLDSFVGDIGTMMDILSNPTAHLDDIMNSMGGEALQKLLAYKNLMDEINEELYERMTIDEKIAYNQEKLSQEASKYKTELADHGFIDIGNLGNTPFKDLEKELQDLLAVPVEQRNAEWEKSYESLKEKIELAKDQYGTLNDTIIKLEEDMFKSEMANQQFSQAWLDGILKGDYNTIREELSSETQDMIDSIISSMSSADWESGATSIGQSMASNIIEAYTNQLVSNGQLKQASALLNDMMFENLNFVNSNGALNFDMLYQLSQQSQKIAVENEMNRQRLEAVNSMFDYTKDIRYSSLEKDINYKTSSTKESIYNITNNNNFNVSGLISSSGDMTIMANALAPYIIEAMRNYGI